MNTIELAGRTTKDVVLAVKGETKIARFAVAVNEGKDKTVFIPVTAFGKTAEAMSKFAGKGSLIAVSGHISVSHKDEKMFMNIVADRVEFLATKKPGASKEEPFVPEVTDEDIQF